MHRVRGQSLHSAQGDLGRSLEPLEAHTGALPVLDTLKSKTSVGPQTHELRPLIRSLTRPVAAGGDNRSDKVDPDFVRLGLGIYVWKMFA